MHLPPKEVAIRVSALSQPSALPAPASSRVGMGRLASLLRALVAIALGIVVTFSSDHSAAFGALVFTVFALATAVVMAVGAVLDRRQGRGSWLPLTLGVLALAAGVAAALLGADYFVVVVSAWALLSGAAELSFGVQARRAGQPARDEIIVGALAVLLAVALLVVPPDYTEPWQVIGRGGEVEAAGSVTADIMTVGVLGAWAIIHGVLVAIAALTPARPEVRP